MFDHDIDSDDSIDKFLIAGYKCHSKHVYRDKKKMETKSIM